MSPAIHDELERFTSYLEQVCGLAAKTRADRRWWVGQFLADRFSRGPIAVDRLTTRDVVDFLVRHGTRYTPGTAGARGCALRSYLRFRAVRCADRVDAFIAAIPTVACWRLASLPSHLTPDETARFLNAFDRRHASGQRGYAMARCLVDLGLRACEVAALQLDDLNWQDGTVRLGAGKSRRADVLPLPVLTGRAIVEYLRQRDRRAPVAPCLCATARRSMRRSRRRSCAMPCGWHSPAVALVPATPAPMSCDGRRRRRCDGPGPA
jgi:integrase